MLGEGRRWFTVTNSDFHNTGGDFWPGEYAKTWTYVKGGTAQDVVNGMRSGRMFVTEGDLVNGLEFQVRHDDRVIGNMGDSIKVRKGDSVNLVIKFRSPATNNNGDHPVVDHVDLITGAVTGKVASGSPDYNNPVNPSTKVLARFWTGGMHADPNGWYTINYRVKNVNGGTYYRLRGTNGAVNSANVDAAGNPVIDSAKGANTPAKAYSDLWFYSNPVWVATK